MPEYQSYLAYERVVALAFVHGVEVGTLNHSAAFARSFVRAAIVDGMERLLTTLDPATSKLPAVALAADKATCGRQTGQVVALIVNGQVALINGV